VSPASTDAVRALIIDHCGDDLAAIGIDPGSVGDDLDLRVAGVLDSLGFLELVTALEDDLQAELDFDELDPAELTVIGPLARHVGAQVSVGGPAANGAEGARR
jgi:acyl carrier protein